MVSPANLESAASSEPLRNADALCVSRTPALALGAFVAAGVVLLMSSSSLRGWSFDRGQATPDTQPVLVFLLPGESEVDTVREAIDSSRIVARTQQGFAVTEGRIVATGHSAVETLLTLANWTDRSLELYVPSSTRVRRSGGGGEPESDADGSSPGINIAELAKKPTLTPFEALAFLKAMDGR